MTEFSKPDENKTGTSLVVVPEKKPPFVPVEADKAIYAELLDMLMHKRPAGSKTEKVFIRKYLKPIADLKMDKFGNYYKRIGYAPVLWSCHTDTVHKRKGYQMLGFDGPEVGLSCAMPEKECECLGADDTAGVWLMLQMIRANRPGLYIFHRAEEIGRLGSRYIAKHHADLLKPIKFAIALDRKGYCSVITHQMGSRCCSDVFAKSLSDALGLPEFKPDSTGSYTDTASYVDLIGECTNISSCYRSAHTEYERLHLEQIFALKDCLLQLDWTKLVEKRKPGEFETKTYSFSNYSGYKGGRPYGAWNWNEDYAGGEWGEPGYSEWWKNKERKREEKFDQTAKAVEIEENLDGISNAEEFDLMVKLIKNHSEVIADILDSYGIGPSELRQEILDVLGVVNDK